MAQPLDFRLSHIHLKVRWTRTAVKRLREAGFVVEYGHKGLISPNAFIFFNDHAFIEVFMMRGPANLAPVFMDRSYGRQMGDRFRMWSRAPEGFPDFAFEPADAAAAEISNMDSVHDALVQEGFDLSRNMISSRKNVRNERVGFGFCALNPPELPFLVTAYSVPQIPAHITHPNGIDRIGRVEVECSRRDYEAMQRLVGRDPKVRLIPGDKTEIRRVVFVSRRADFTPPPIQGLFGMNTGFETEQDSTERKK